MTRSGDRNDGRHEAVDPLDEILAAFLRAEESGAPDRSRLLREHPEHADELREFFADRDRLRRLAFTIGPAAHPIAVLPEFTLPENIRYFGDYELLEEVARGGMGVVYKARQVSLNRTVAVKMIRAGEFASDEDVKRFHAEAEAAANLQHPAIVAIHEVGLHQGRHYFSMDYVEGQSLAAAVREQPLPPRRAAELVREVADAVAYAHAKGVLHRDLKPSNVLVDGTGRARVTDFGLAARVEGESSLTRTGQVLGTPSYMPPEQARGERVGVAADVYSLGAVLYELMTGRPPFKADSAVETLRQVLDDDPAPPRLLNAAVPLDLETVCLKCLRKEPEGRYATSAAVADDLGRFLSGEPILARPLGRVTRVWRWSKRKPAAAAAAITTLVAVLSLISGAMVLSDAYRVREAYSTSEGLRTRLEVVLGQARRAEAAEAAARQAAEQGRFREQSLRKAKEAVLTDLEVSHAATERQRQIAEAALDESRSYLYLQRIALADLAYRDNDVLAAQRSLEQCAVELRNWEWHYLNGLCHAELGTFESGLAGDNELLNVALHPDGKRFIAVTPQNAAVWNLVTGRQDWLLPNSANEGRRITCAKFTPDAAYLLTGGTRGWVDVWELQSRRPLRSFVIDPQSDSSDKSGSDIASLAISPDGTLVATGHAKGLVALSETSTGQLIRTFNDGNRRTPVTRLAFDREGERLVSTSAAPAAERSGVVIMHLIKTGEVLFQETALAADISPAGLLATAHLNGTISLREVAHAEQKVTVLPGHTAAVRHIRFSPDGSHLVSCGDDRTVRVWTGHTGTPLGVHRGHRAPVLTFDISLDGRRIVSGDVRGVAKCWNTNVDHETLVTKVVEGPTDTSRLWPVGVSFSPDGQQLAIAMRHGRLHVVDAAIGKELWSEQRSGTFSLAYQPHTDLLLALRDNALVMRKASTGAEIFEVATEANGFGSRVAFSRDGESFAAATKEGVGVFEAATGKLVRTLVCDGERWLTDVAFSKDGNRLAAAINIGSWTKGPAKVVMWDLVTGSQVLELTDTPNSILDLDFSTDGHLLAAGGGDLRRIQSGSDLSSGEVRIWNGLTGELIHELRGHQACVWSIAFSPDGTRLIAGSGGWAANSSRPAELKLWDVRHGQEVLSLPGHTKAVLAVNFSPDGSQIVSAGMDRIVRIWGPRTRGTATAEKVFEPAVPPPVEAGRPLRRAIDHQRMSPLEAPRPAS